MLQWQAVSNKLAELKTAIESRTSVAISRVMLKAQVLGLQDAKKIILRKLLKLPDRDCCRAIHFASRCVKLRLLFQLSADSITAGEALHPCPEAQ